MREDCDFDLAEQVLKSDSLSRVRTPPARREEILAEFERSGLSGARFAKLHGISYQTFMAWRRKRQAAPASADEDRVGELAARLGLHEVGVGIAGHGQRSSLEIEIGGGVRFRVATAEQAELAARIIDSLRRGQPSRPC